MKWPRPAPLEPATQPPSDRYCDLVLTGGVTDGIVYPWAVQELARAYRFKNIGGTSVGAMAAALTAAAEYGRRNGSLAGFNEVMLKVPERLAEDVDGKDGKGRTRIFSLFQPARSTRRLFDFFVALIGSGDLSLESSAKAGVRTGGKPPRSLARKLLVLFPLYLARTLVGALLGVLVAALATLAGLNPCAAVLLALAAGAVFSILLVACGVYRDLTVSLIDNDYGLCTGYRAAKVPATEPSLIEWLHEGIQAAAGRNVHDDPLAFRDLWEAPGGPQSDTDLPPARKRKPRSIDLRMITTNLGHARPYEFPLKKDDPALYFKVEELRRFFPSSVVAYLEANSPLADPANEPGLRTLPRDRLPVVVAARLSLSFPVLFSAVPLWAQDHDRSRLAGKPIYARCRFSDGGICSNFPIHLFDAAVPAWPTFGISLVSDAPERDPVWLSRYHYQGRDDSWLRFDEQRSLFGFLAAVVYSAKDWNDKTSTHMPGVRDRVVRIALDIAGSLNLKLTRFEMRKLARFGQKAGLELLAKFIAPDRPAAAWDEHRWVRFHTFVAGLRDRIERLAEGTGRAPYCIPLAAQIRSAEQAPPLDHEDPAQVKTLSAAQAGALQALLSALLELEQQFARAALPQPYKPEPAPDLQIRAPL